MLSRTAENLFWIARYIERAENVARLIDMGYRMARLPHADDPATNDWASVLLSSGAAGGFSEPLAEADQERVAHWLLLDHSNPSSAMSCIAHARDNARGARNAISSEVWEAINDGWMEFRFSDENAIRGGALPRLIDWIKQRAALFRGCVDSTLLHGEGFQFLRMGVHIERADNTSRLLDVKYHVLLPDQEHVGGSVDYYQWISILRAANSVLAYQVCYKDGVKPWNVSDFLILNRQAPRSLYYCCSTVCQRLDRLAELYGDRWPCHDVADALRDKLAASGMGEIFQQGLHEFLTEFIASNSALADSIATSFGFAGALTPSREIGVEE